MIAILSFLSCCVLSQSSADHKSIRRLVGQCNAGTAILAQLTYQSNAGDTLYTFTLRNHSGNAVESLCSISFAGTSVTVNQLYSTIKRLIYLRNKKHKDYSTTVALADKLVVLSSSRNMGSSVVKISFPQCNNMFTEWQVDKLFGKQ